MNMKMSFTKWFPFSLGLNVSKRADLWARMPPGPQGNGVADFAITNPMKNARLQSTEEPLYRNNFRPCLLYGINSKHELIIIYSTNVDVSSLNYKHAHFVASPWKCFRVDFNHGSEIEKYTFGMLFMMESVGRALRKGGGPNWTPIMISVALVYHVLL